MTKLHYAVSGPDDAPAVVLSNSLGTALDMWDAQAAALARRYRVVRYDTRGHGRSEVPAPPYTIDDLGRDVLSLLDSLDIERAHFVGLSMGGVTGQWLGIHAPSRIDKLVLSNTAARVGTADGWHARAELVRARGMDEVAAASPARWFTPSFISSHPARVDALIAQVRQTPPQGYAGCCEALAETDLRDTIDRIAAPTLVIAGEHDPLTTVADAQFIVERIRGARLATLSASHLSNVEAEASFNDVLAPFLDE